MAYVKVKDKENLVKDPTTGVVLNTNRANYMARRAKKHREKMQEQKIKSLENEMMQMREILTQVLKNGN